MTAARDQAGGATYHGITMRADVRLHEQIAEQVLAEVEAGARVLDFGAGEGALSQRLADLGYQVHAVDLDEGNFKARVPFEKLDFDDAAQVQAFVARHRGAFDLVLGVEVIEHVENPWDYLRDLKSLVRPGGLVLLSTPNITSAYSRVHFLFTGRFAQFNEPDLAYGHIAPITSWELGVIARRLGLEVVREAPGGWTRRMYPRQPWRLWLVNALAVLLAPFMRGPNRGHCLIVLLRKHGKG